MLCDNMLTVPNFLEWRRILRMVLRIEKKLYVLNGPILGILSVNAIEHPMMHIWNKMLIQILHVLFGVYVEDQHEQGRDHNHVGIDFYA